MKKPRGRTVPLSLPRRWIGDLVTFSRKVPTVAGEKHLRVKALVEARRSITRPPSWSAIIIKAYGMVSARIPEFRRSYLSLPTGRLYEYPFSVAAVIINRKFQGESAVFPALIQAPEHLSLREIDARIRAFTTGPIEDSGCYRRLIRTARLPKPLRRASWWLGLNVLGRLRTKTFGTFSVNTTAGLRFDVTQFLTPITSTLYYGVPDSRGRLKIQIAIDHRVFDGATAAQGCHELEKILNTEMVAEVLADDDNPVPQQFVGQVA